MEKFECDGMSKQRRKFKAEDFPTAFDNQLSDSLRDSDTPRRPPRDLPSFIPIYKSRFRTRCVNIFLPSVIACPNVPTLQYLLSLCRAIPTLAYTTLFMRPQGLFTTLRTCSCLHDFIISKTQLLRRLAGSFFCRLALEELFSFSLALKRRRWAGIRSP